MLLPSYCENGRTSIRGVGCQVLWAMTRNGIPGSYSRFLISFYLHMIKRKTGSKLYPQMKNESSTKVWADLLRMCFLFKVQQRKKLMIGVMDSGI